MTLRSLLAVAAVATCSAGAAMAADLPVRTAPPAPFYAAPVFTWTGFYAGINAGANFGSDLGRANATGFTTAAGFANSASATAAIPGSFGSFGGGDSDAGFVGGGQIGYNIQNGMFVYGIEADIDYFSAGSNNRTFADTNLYAEPGSTLTLSGRGGDGYLGTVRGRLGLAAFDRTLLYVTGGLAYGDYGNTYRLATFSNGAAAFQLGNSPTNSDIRIGYALGAGVEYAFTQKISAKIEYLHTDLGSRNYALTNVNAPGAAINVHQNYTADIARVGLNYKF